MNKNFYKGLYEGIGQIELSRVLEKGSTMMGELCIF